MTATQTHTARSAMAVARNAYVRMAAKALADVEDPRMGRVAERAFARGNEILLGLEATASDVALTPAASGALDAHLRAIEVADLGGAMAWLDLFPEIIRDVRRDAEMATFEVFLVGSIRARVELRPQTEQPSSDGYRTAARQRPLALAS